MGQDDPRNIPDMMELLRWWVWYSLRRMGKGRKDSMFIRTISSGWKHIRNYLVDDGVHDAGTQFRVYKKMFWWYWFVWRAVSFHSSTAEVAGFKVTEMKQS